MGNFFISTFDLLNSMLFYKVFGFPLLVIWLMSATFYLSFKLKFPNVRFFKHAIEVGLKNKYYSKNDVGDITPRQALLTSIAGSVGLGNIAGVAIAINLGGPGAIFWMIVYCFFSMNTVFAETALSQTYRKVDKTGKIVGGPFRYLRYGLEDIGHRKAGTILAIFFSFMLVFGTIGGTMFQINQTVSILTDYETLRGLGIVFTLMFASLCLYTLLSGVKSVGKIIEKIMPIIFALYVFCAIAILAVNYKNIPASFALIIKDAFSGAGAITGGLVGSIAVAIQRISFASEAGLGTGSIANATAKTKEPIRQAAVASLIPIVGTTVFCFLTAIIIITSGAYSLNGSGIIITKRAFLSVSNWFPIFLSIIVTMVATSNMLSYSFYGQTAWKGLLKGKYIFVFNTTLIIAIIFSHTFDVDSMVKIADTLMLGIAIPNIIGVYLLSGLIKKKMNRYSEQLKSGDFEKKSHFYEFINRLRRMIRVLLILRNRRFNKFKKKIPKKQNSCS